MDREQLEKELKELKETVNLYEQILELRKKLEELGYKLDREKEYIPYPYPYPVYPEPYKFTWGTTGTPVGALHEDTVTW
jgi:Zn-finger domain-containing protein